MNKSVVIKLEEAEDIDRLATPSIKVDLKPQVTGFGAARELLALLRILEEVREGGKT